MQQEKPERIIRPRHGISGINFAELARYRELLFFLAWRDILIRYKQTLIGMAWAVLRPVLTMVVLTFVFGKLGKFDSKGASYSVMTLSAILPWQFFASALSSGSNSVVAASNMVRKVYFPRVLIPASVTLGGIVDFIIAMLILFCMMIWKGVAFDVRLLLLPFFFLVALMAAFGASLWLSALNVKYRDVKYIVPFIAQMGLYVSPVGFMTSVVPEKWLFLYSLNPMVGVIDGFRWCILGSQFEPGWEGFWISTGMVILIFISGLFFFRNTEKTFADVI